MKFLKLVIVSVFMINELTFASSYRHPYPPGMDIDELHELVDNPKWESTNSFCFQLNYFDQDRPSLELPLDCNLNFKEELSYQRNEKVVIHIAHLSSFMERLFNRNIFASSQSILINGLPIRNWVQTENGVIFLEKIVNVIKNNSQEEERGGNENGNAGSGKQVVGDKFWKGLVAGGLGVIVAEVIAVTIATILAFRSIP